MTKHSPFFLLLSAYFLIGFGSCTKINEGTELGADLIPGVDNVNTFDTTLSVITDNLRFNALDSTRLLYNDFVAAGKINNDPEFGSTEARFHFNLLPGILGIYPFGHKDSTRVIDSVVLSLSYQGGYGDTATASQTLRVFEIDPASGFRYDTLYKFTDPATDFATTGGELGSKTFTVAQLKDSITITRPRDTSKVANVVRIRLNNSLAQRFLTFDTTNGALGGFHNDSTRGNNFRRLFPGFAIRAENPGSNLLTYYRLDDGAKTRLTVYFKVLHTNNVNDTLSFDFFHSTNGQANYISNTPGGAWAASLSPGADDKVYIQSAPSGSYAAIRIPALSTFGNRVIHRAELITTRIPSAGDDRLTPPSRLFLDRKNSNVKDTAFSLFRDLGITFDGSIDFASFGGNLKNNGYRFNITRHVQGIVTRNEPNDTLRLYAPLRSIVFAPNISATGSFIAIPVAERIASGRVVLAGGSHPVLSERMRLRIIYSNIK